MSDCACVYGGDSDAPSFYTTTMPRARKAHRCGECRRVIAAGEVYEKTAGCWDGFCAAWVARKALGEIEAVPAHLTRATRGAAAQEK